MRDIYMKKKTAEKIIRIYNWLRVIILLVFMAALFYWLRGN